MASDYTAQYAQALDVIAPGITTEVAQTQAQGETWVDSLSRLLPILATTYQQRQLLEIQLDRARQGLPPLDASQYSPAVRVGLTSDTTKLLLIGGALVLAALVLPQLMKRR